MITALPLGVGAWPWQRPGVAELATWLSALVAGEAPPPLTLAIGAADTADEALIEAELRRASPTPELDRITALELPGGATPADLIGRWLGLPLGAAPLAPLARQLSEAAGGGLQLAVIQVDAEQLAPARQAAEEALAASRAHWREAPIGIILRAAGPLSGDPIRLDRAWPLLTPAAPETTWARYVHIRLAWHAAGELDRLADLPDLPVNPADTRLSAALDRLAARWFGELPAACQAALGQADADHLPLRLAERGLILDRTAGWPGQPLPSPWLARHLLACVPNHPARRQLRAAQACRPWISELMDRCLWIEALIRDRLPPPTSDTGSGEAIYERFGRGRGAEHDLIIDRHPANPLNPEDFYSLGELAYGQAGEWGGFLHDLRLLRNVLAHGHAVGWAAHEQLERLEERAMRLA